MRTPYTMWPNYFPITDGRLTDTSIWLQLDTYKLLEINPEIKEIKEGGETSVTIIKDYKANYWS
jgi:hypothetical protein